MEMARQDYLQNLYSQIQQSQSSPGECIFSLTQNNQIDVRCTPEIHTKAVSELLRQAGPVPAVEGQLNGWQSEWGNLTSQSAAHAALK